MQVAYQEYVDSEVLTADPVRMVQLMYRGALDAIASARESLAEGDIAARSRQISRAVAILNELALSLDRSLVPELTGNLARLYDYMSHRLLEANFRQIDEPLAEVQQLLGTLLGAWQQDAPAAPPAGYAVEPPLEYQGVSYAW